MPALPAWTRPGWHLELHLGISNPNIFDLSLLGPTYSLQVAPLPLATGEVQEKFLFPAGIETDMRLPVPLKFSGLLGILSHTPDPDNLHYQLNGILIIMTPLGGMSVPIEKLAILALPEPYRKAGIIRRSREPSAGASLGW